MNPPNDLTPSRTAAPMPGALPDLPASVLAEVRRTPGVAEADGLVTGLAGLGAGGVLGWR